MRLARSLGFLRPAKTILVPGMYFFGLKRYWKRCSLLHTMPDDLLAAVYEKPGVVPAARPRRPCRLGPCLCGPPASTVWHCAHFFLKILAPWGVVKDEYKVR